MEKQAMCSAVGESLMRSVQESKKELAVQAETTFKKEQIGEHRINYDHYRVLQEVDGKEQLRIVPKLTAEHVCPDNMRKMSVKLAVQIIQDFMIILDLTERNHVEKGTAMFASQVTMESLRVTLSSILELTNDLLAKGARYVLTGKLNQDPLERFFGITRSFGGDEDHPTILSFSHIYRLLSLYTPVKASIAGNVQEEPTLILATVQETMKQGKKQQLATYEKLRETISAKISERRRSRRTKLFGRRQDDAREPRANPQLRARFERPGSCPRAIDVLGARRVGVAKHEFSVSGPVDISGTASALERPELLTTSTEPTSLTVCVYC
ncbi:hypothetical protein HPB51_010169 [Rhipicephalus microplus]|uniref:Transposable element P transposase-like RNase H C-terminal domain-containing protein n=1 Tax=Rhipicephalus microplus TaxID=6941 RepID=A0A9J6F241_RHIMP|nr:hypothetical protein HPB51_010169 [Rhipicephalus microplus]